MATKVVAKTGNNANTGNSFAQAYLTINYACSQISGGDTIDIYAGVYAEVLQNNIPSGTAGAPTRLVAHAGNTVTLTPNAGTNWAIELGLSQEYIVFDGINLNGVNSDVSSCLIFDNRTATPPNYISFINADVSNGSGNGQGGGALLVGGDNHFFSNLTVHGTSGPLGFYISGNSNLVQDCTIYNTSLAGIQIYHGSGNASGNIINRCIIRDVTQSYFFGTIDDRLIGVLVAGDSNTVSNCKIYGLNLGRTASGNSGGIFQYYGVGNHYYNNSIGNCVTRGINIESGTSAQVINNICYNNTTNYLNTGTSTTHTTNIDDGTDPLWVNVSANDFTLSAGSPAIDTGTTLASVTTDFLGVARPQGAGYCRGALEFIPPSGETLWTPMTPVTATGDASFTFAQSAGITTTGAKLLVMSLGRSIFASTAVTVTDSYANTWIPLTRQDPLVFASQLYYVINPTVGTGHTFRVENVSANLFPSFVVYPFAASGVVTFGGENGSAVGDTESTIQPGSVTPSADDALIVTGATTFAVPALPTVDLGFAPTSVAAAPDYGGTSLGFVILGTAAARNPTWDFGTTDSYGYASTIAWFTVTASPHGLLVFRRRR